jgi:hypothetical protein
MVLDVDKESLSSAVVAGTMGMDTVGVMFMFMWVDIWEAVVMVMATPPMFMCTDIWEADIVWAVVIWEAVIWEADVVWAVVIWAAEDTEDTVMVVAARSPAQPLNGGNSRYETNTSKKYDNTDLPPSSVILCQ